MNKKGTIVFIFRKKYEYPLSGEQQNGLKIFLQLYNYAQRDNGVRFERDNLFYILTTLDYQKLNGLMCLFCPHINNYIYLICKNKLLIKHRLPLNKEIFNYHKKKKITFFNEKLNGLQYVGLLLLFIDDIEENETALRELLKLISSSVWRVKDLLCKLQ